MTFAERVLLTVRRLGVPSYGDDEVLFIAETVEACRPDAIFDWGTNVGASARVLYEAAREAALACDVHTVELPDDVYHREHPGTGRYARWLMGLEHIHLYRGDGAETAAALCLRTMPQRPLFFVDGEHASENVLRELETIAAVAPKGVMLIHDTCAHAGLGVRAFRDWHPGRYSEHMLASQAGLTRLWPLESAC